MEYPTTEQQRSTNRSYMKVEAKPRKWTSKFPGLKENLNALLDGRREQPFKECQLLRYSGLVNANVTR
ncbi:hypothetical protein NECAME_01487 [Necator americanus]|uniref:Uncharacterized protein n=1 Tax=Necator americanus TaxID=51031 RepID=W2TV60_NECAM|nr:hypothetical protein NECAME_01487 [Necator americanus]ETN84927.1 hypothetical protein NECAME_01487 [Necator americanus]